MMPYLPAVMALLSVNAVGHPEVRATDPPSMVVEVVGKGFFGIHPIEKQRVKGEEQVIGDDQPGACFGGVSPKLTLGPVDPWSRLPRVLDPSSLVVRSKDGVVYEEGKDYMLDHLWGGIGRIASGRIKTGETIVLDYDISLQRIDAVQMSPDGHVSIKEGESTRVCAPIPEVDKGFVRLANVYVTYNAKEITQPMIYPVTDSKLTWRDFIKIEGKDNLSNVRKLLSEGKDVKIVCYGDSVTQGCSASSTDKCYVGLLKPEIEKLYPKAKVEVVNAGIGGTHTDQRLPDMDEQVLKFNPDLVVVEFVNDMPYTKEKLIANYFQLIDRVRAKNPKADIIILTPHYIMPEWMGNFHNSCSVLREIAREKKVGLGDTANIWGNLSKIGVPYTSLLPNEINHPDDLGHRFFAETVTQFLK